MDSFKTKLQRASERVLKHVSKDGLSREEAVRKEAEKFKTFNAIDLRREKVASAELRNDLAKQLSSIEDPIDREEAQIELDLCLIREEILTMAVEIRKERYYRKPSHKLSELLSGSGIFSTSTERKANTKKIAQIEDDAGVHELVRQSGRANFYHPSGKDLTIQDAKVLIALNTLWERSGRRKEMNIPRTEIAREMGITRRSKNYDDIYESLLTILETQIEFHYFYETGRLARRGRMGILQDVHEINEGEGFFVRFGDTVHEQMQTGAMVRLSLAMLEDLPSNTAKGLYIFLASQVVEGIYSWRLEELYSLMGLRANRPKKRYEQIDSACIAMKGVGLFLDYVIHESETGDMTLHIKPSPILMQSKDAWSPENIQPAELQVMLALDEPAPTEE